MNKTKMIYFLSAIVCIIGCYALNLSYSLFVQTETKNVVDATVPSLSYSLETSEFTIPANSNQIIELKVINSGIADIKYGVLLENANLSENIKLQLVSGSNDIIGETKSEDTSVIKIYVENNNTSAALTLNFKLEAIYSTLNLDETKYTNGIIDRVNLYKAYLTETLLNNAMNASAANNTNRSIYVSNISSTSYTKPGETSAENERLFVESDYSSYDGTITYYYRGNVVDNYLNYSGMCWRIVNYRLGEGIKLVLADAHNECDDDGSIDGTAYSTKDNDSGFYFKCADNECSYVDEVSEYTSSWDSDESLGYDGEYKGFGAVYNGASVFLENSTIFGRPETSNIINLDYLEENSWCREIEDEPPYYTYEQNDLGCMSQELGYQFRQDGGIYDINPAIPFRLWESPAKDRIVVSNQPDFGCSTQLYKTSYIASLTADEIIYAGAEYGISNTSYYLYTNANSQNTWTITPYSAVESDGNSYYCSDGAGWDPFSNQIDSNVSLKYMNYSTMFVVNTEGALTYENVGPSAAIRPSIVLNRNISYIGGSGLANDPYIVGEIIE